MNGASDINHQENQWPSMVVWIKTHLKSVVWSSETKFKTFVWNTSLKKEKHRTSAEPGLICQTLSQQHFHFRVNWCVCVCTWWKRLCSEHFCYLNNWTQRLWKVPTFSFRFLFSQQPIRSDAADASSVSSRRSLTPIISGGDATTSPTGQTCWIKSERIQAPLQGKHSLYVEENHVIWSSAKREIQSCTK